LAYLNNALKDMIKNHRRGHDEEYDEEIKELEDILAKQRKIGNQEVIATSLNDIGMIYERKDCK
jgi:hypothetical protein